MKLDAYTNSDCHLSEAKRIYLNGVEMDCICPKCKETITFSNNIPILTGSFDETYYCHCFSCDDCGYESEEKMYSVNKVGDDYIDLKVNYSDFEITFHEFQRVQLKEEN